MTRENSTRFCDIQNDVLLCPPSSEPALPFGRTRGRLLALFDCESLVEWPDGDRAERSSSDSRLKPLKSLDLWKENPWILLPPAWLGKRVPRPPNRELADSLLRQPWFL